jgi:hypothetical protein
MRPGGRPGGGGHTQGAGPPRNKTRKADAVLDTGGHGCSNRGAAERAAVAGDMLTRRSGYTPVRRRCMFVQRRQAVCREAGPVQVLAVFQEAINRLQLQPPLWQASVKPAVVVAVDQLIGFVHGTESPLPWLLANGVDTADLEGIIANTRHFRRESMVDVAVYRRETDPYETLATAESEAFCDHEASLASTSDTSDYLWDLYKLLQVPSPIRLFVARVRNMERCRVLEGRIEFLVSAYCGALREGDRVFSIVLPTAKRDYGSILCRGWERSGDALMSLPAASWT